MAKGNVKQLAGVLAMLVVWGAASELSDILSDIDVVPTDTDSDSLDANDSDPLRDWLFSLNIPIPSMTAELPMGLGMFTVKSGYCTGINVGDLTFQDRSSGLLLDFSVQVTGVGVSCVILGESGGPIDINITLADSSVNASLQVLPYVNASFPDLPLPMGGLKFTGCTADIEVSDLNWDGSGDMYDMLGWFGPPEAIAGMIGMLVDDPICDGIGSLLEGEGSSVLLKGAGKTEEYLSRPLPAQQPKAISPILNWAEYPPIVVIQALFRERFQLFEDRVVQMIDVAGISSQVATSDAFNVTLENLRIEGQVDGDREPDVKVIAQGSTLGVSANLDYMRFNTVFDLTIALPGQPIFSHRVNMTMGLEEVAMSIRAMVNKDSLTSMENDGSMSSPACLLQCTEGTTDPWNASVDFESFDVELAPLLQLHSVGELERETTDLINMFVASLYKAYLPTINVVVNSALGKARDSLDTKLWQRIDNLEPCSKVSYTYMINEESVVSLWSTAGLLALLGLPISALVHLVVAYRNRKLSQQTPQNGGEEPSATAKDESRDAAASTNDVNVVVTTTKEAQSTGPCALCNESFVPTAFAVYYPFLVVATMFLFAYADLDLGATVTLVMESDGKQSNIGPLFAFSLVSTVAQCWESGALVIAFLTIIASGVWPFIKLSFLLIAWLVPPQRFSLRVREQVLSGLDSWGKYSFLDSWFLVVMLSAFMIEWDSVGTASMKILVTPAPAFYAFFAATTFSLILGHVASECHQYADATRAELNRERAAAKQSASARELYKSETEELAPLGAFTSSKKWRLGLALLLAVSLLLTSLGSFLTSFSFKVSGLLPQFLFGHETETFFSLFSAGVATAKGRYDNFGLMTLEVAFVLLAVVLPLLLLATLLGLWLVPLKLSSQKKLLHSCHMIDAWACLDVAILVMVIVCLQFEDLVKYLVYGGDFADACNLIKDLSQEECLAMDIHAHAGLGLLFLTGILLLIVPKIGMSVCAKSIERRTKQPSLKSVDSGKLHNIGGHKAEDDKAGDNDVKDENRQQDNRQDAGQEVNT